MFGVVLGHSITNFMNGTSCSCNCTWFIRLYDMPFFMFVSGYFLSFSLQKYSVKQLLLNKVTMVLCPTIIWALLESRGKSILGFYFLWAVFISSFVIILTENFFLKKWLKNLCYSALIVTLYIIDNKIFNLLYLFPFFLLGYKHYDLIEKYKFYHIIIFMLGICFWKTDYTIWNADTNITHGLNVFLIDIYRLLMGFSGIVVMNILFEMIYNYCVSHDCKRLLGFSDKIGKETLGLYIFQEFVCFFILRYAVNILEKYIGFNIFAQNQVLTVYFIAPLFAIITLLVCYKVISLIKSNKYSKILFGFKYQLKNE